MTAQDGNGGRWTLLTSHGHVLVEIARDPTARLRDIAAVTGLTERAVQVIVADLEAAGYLTPTPTQYSVNRDNPFRHSAQQGLRIGLFLDLLPAAEPADGHDRALSRSRGLTGARR